MHTMCWCISVHLVLFQDVNVGDDTKYEMMFLRRALPKSFTFRFPNVHMEGYGKRWDFPSWPQTIRQCNQLRPWFLRAQTTTSEQLSYTIIIQALSDGLGYGIGISSVTHQSSFEAFKFSHVVIISNCSSNKRVPQVIIVEMG